MRILPSRTEPPPHQHRRHQPDAKGEPFFYRKYRQCLRWDFGFTCAFCLLHERDLSILGTEGLGLMSIEHFEPQSARKDLINRYDNCFLSCSRCNSSRNGRPTSHTEGDLLNPCEADWNERFVLDGSFRFQLREPNDGDAERTLRLYDLNDPLKVSRRKKRSQATDEAWSLYWRSVRLLAELPDMPDLEMAELLLEERVRALRALDEWDAIPADAAPLCFCKMEEACSLPRWLDEQCTDLPTESR